MNFSVTTLVLLLVSIIMDYTVMAKPKQYLIETEEQDVDNDKVTNDYMNQGFAYKGKLILPYYLDLRGLDPHYITTVIYCYIMIHCYIME